MINSPREYPYRAPPAVMLGCMVVFGAGGAISSYAAVSNERGMDINGLITLSRGQAPVFWWVTAGICFLFVLLAMILPLWWWMRGERIIVSDTSISVPTSLFRRGITVINFEDIVAVNESTVRNQRMLSIVHRGGSYAIPAGMVGEGAYAEIMEAIVAAMRSRAQAMVG